MNNMQYQKGMTGLGWILVLALIAFFTLIGLKVIPVYMNSMTVGSILSDMEDEPGLGSKSPAEIMETLGKRLSINMIKDISRDEIYLESDKDLYYIDIEYEVRRDFIGNIDLVLSFSKTAEIPKQ
ncbi:MAG: DUF4845 domain-containing protein [Thiohalophilus sp.]|uniref:DUF4845 domain-containing protein n=1 Tax=Thiohalophilus sp. TaxID=3028392 RepID=UPI0028702C3A|nr:DUF4845 domain-containing protein [Thiohalophilus sp.]MDR9436932.1 DUF4845 domain-containing protein [Thiohalophilus sp.]